MYRKDSIDNRDCHVDERIFFVFDAHLISILSIVDCKIKRWWCFSQIIRNTHISSIWCYLNIVCALNDSYQRTERIDKVAEVKWDAQMMILLDKENQLEKCLERMEEIRYWDSRFHDIGYRRNEQNLFRSLETSVHQWIEKHLSLWVAIE
jgi:hypothetical protein